MAADLNPKPLSQSDIAALVSLGQSSWIGTNPAAPKKGKSFWGKFSNVGSTALKALGVPQAVAFTGIRKLGHAVAPGSVSDVSWKNLGGDFYGGYKGAEMLGVHNKWAKLATEIVADPLWFAGGVTVAAKGAKAAKGATNVAGVARDVAAIANLDKGRQLEALAHVGVRKATRHAVAEGVDKQDLAKALMNMPSTKGAQRAARKIAAESRGVKRIGPQADWKQISAALERLKPRADAGRTRLSPGAREGLGKALTGRDVPGDLSRIDFDAEFKVMHGIERQLARAAEAHTAMVSKPARELAIRLGTGRHNVKLRTGITRKATDFSNLKQGRFKLSPIEEGAFRIKRSGREFGEVYKHQIENVAKRLDLDKLDRYAIHIVANAGDGPARDKAIAALTKMGRWDQKHQDGLRFLHELGRRESAQRGFVSLPDRISEKEHRLSELMTERARREEHLNRVGYDNMVGRTGKLAKAHDPKTLDAEIEKVRGELDLLKSTPDEYVANAPTAASVQEHARAMREATRRGEATADTRYLLDRASIADVTKSRVFEDAFKTVTPANFVDDMVRAGFEPAEATALRDAIGLDRFGPDAAKFADSGVTYKPEWDSFSVAAESRKAYSATYARDKLVLDFLEKVGVPINSEAGMAARLGSNIANQPGTLSYRFGDVVKPYIVALKSGYTTINISHFVNNVLGDLVNRQVNGNIRHLGTRAAVPNGEMWRLANGDIKLMDKVYEVGGVKMTGAELLAQAHLAGIGHGMIAYDVLGQGDDIADISKIQTWLADPKNPFGFMSRLNARREASQRLETWLKHVRAGDDPFTAAEKTLRVHFDYQHLTAFEQNWMRNLFLFYTWMKRNTLLHSGGLLTRPGIYQAYGDLERNRQPILNEPDYFQTQGAVTLPFGLGNVAFMNPINDLHKLSFSLAGARQLLMSPLNPVARVPAEVMTNQNFFTGRPIQDYSGQVKPHWLTQLLGVGPMARARQGGERANSLNPYLGYLLDQVVGPQAARLGTATNPDYESAHSSQWLDVLGSVLGIKEQADRPQQYLKTKLAKEAIRKRNETRAKRAREEGS